jgi:hypothetical protein
MPSRLDLLQRSLRRGLATGLALGALLGLGNGAHAQDLKPEQRLEAIRAALVEAALKSNTRVSTTSWMDTRGALLELNRFSSEIRLRDIQMGQYVPTRQGDTKRVGERVELSEQTLATVTPVSCIAPRARSPIRHVMRVSLDLASSIAPEHHYIAQKIGFAARQHALQASAQTQHWRLMTDVAYKRAYERLIYGQGEEAVQWSLQLTVLPARAHLNTNEHPAFILAWQVQSGPNKPVWFGAQNLLFGVTIPSSYGTPKLDVDTLTSIEMTVNNMAKELDRQLACDPQSFAVEKNEDGHLVLQAGRTSGLRVGDQIVLADARLLPGRAIESGALDAAVLAEVKSVSDYQSEIRQVAGKKQTFQGGWVAWPFIY